MADELTQIAQDSARGGFFLVSGTALATIIMAIAAILIARFLGPELYGQYALALVAPQLLYLFTDLGINQGITKFAAAQKSKDETSQIFSLIKHGLLIRATIGIAIFLINYTFAEQIASLLLQRPELAFYIQLASISILFQVIFTTTTSAFVGLDKTEYQALTTNIEATAKTIVSIALILIGFSITGAIIGYITGYMIAAIVGASLLIALMRSKNKTAPKTSSFKTNATILFQYGTPLYISALLIGFLPLFKNMILALFTTDIAIGNYKAAINFAALLLALAGPITTILLPAFSKLNSTTNHKIKDFYKIANKYTSMIIIPVTILIITLSKEIVQIVYGTTYEFASLFLSIYCLIYFLVGIGYLTLPSLYNGVGETKTTLKINIIDALTLIILAIPLTQTYGVSGIIAAFLIAKTASTLYGANKARKKLKVEFDNKNIIKIYTISALSAAAPLIVINLTNLPNILAVALSSILYLFIYITLLPLTNIVSPTELQKILQVTRNTLLLTLIAEPILKYQQKILQLRERISVR